MIANLAIGDVLGAPKGEILFGGSDTVVRTDPRLTWDEVSGVLAIAGYAIPKLVASGSTTVGAGTIATLTTWQGQAGRSYFWTLASPNGSPGKRYGMGASAPYATGFNVFTEDTANVREASLRADNGSAIGLTIEWAVWEMRSS